MSDKKQKVLFVCIGNMIRSQMAEGFARDMASSFLDVYSAGVRHTGAVSEEAVVVMEEKGVDIRSQWSKGLKDVPLEEMDYVISLCRYKAEDMCPPSFKGAPLNWPVDDPLGHAFEYFRAARDEIENKVKSFVQDLWKSGSVKGGG